MSWSTVIQAAAISALTSLLRLILATLPANPAAQPSIQQNFYQIPRAMPGVRAVENDEAVASYVERDQSEDGSGA